eukprot:scaffold5783_cov129-Amphora_coffeaeformis.AAC.22
MLIFPGGKAFRYAQSKLANSVMTYAMDQKLQAKHSNVKACCAHPGASQTNLGASIQLPWYERILFDYIMQPFIFQSAEDGTMGLLTGMMASEAKSGSLYGPVGMGGLNGRVDVIPPKPEENDQDTMNMLWKISEETTGVTFSI